MKKQEVVAIASDTNEQLARTLIEHVVKAIKNARAARQSIKVTIQQGE